MMRLFFLFSSLAHIASAYVASGATTGTIRFATNEEREKAVDRVAGENMKRWVMHLGGLCPECLQGGARHLASSHFGCADAEMLLPALSYIWHQKRRIYDESSGFVPGLLIDGGANVGKSSIAWENSFGNPAGRIADLSYESRNITSRHIVCPFNKHEIGALIVSIEPNPKNFDLLFEYKHGPGWMGVKAALGTESEQDVQMAVSPDHDIDEVGTLHFDKSADTREKINVFTTTLELVVFDAIEYFTGPTFKQRWKRYLVRETIGKDADKESDTGKRQLAEAEASVAEQLPKQVWFSMERPVFLLKLDIEGFESRVLMNSDYLLRQRLVKFLVFEFSETAWHERENGEIKKPAVDILEETVEFLFEKGYMCFLITKQELYPVGGPFWNKEYFGDMITWSNFFCGVAGDPDLDQFMILYHFGSVYEEAASTEWSSFKDTYLEHEVEDHWGKTYDLAEAKALCEAYPKNVCGGVTCKTPGSWTQVDPATEKVSEFPKFSNTCSLRNGGGGGPFESSSGETSFVRPVNRAQIALPFFAWRKLQPLDLRPVMNGQLVQGGDVA